MVKKKHRSLVKLLLLVSPLVFVHVSHAAWKNEDMTQEATEADNGSGTHLVTRLDSLENIPELPGTSCGKEKCFKLYYFKGEPFDTTDSKRKNILYITGGPGAIPDRFQGDLTVLQKRHNVISFDPRGAGLSPLDRSNELDRFLRAKYIVGDIEQIRIKELGNGENSQWDAVYAHSYGTVVAQIYASLHPKRVKRLILSAPIDRHTDTEMSRTDQVLRNLDDTYRLIRFKYRNAACNSVGEIGQLISDGKTPTEVRRRIRNPELEKITIEKTDLSPTLLCGDDFSFLKIDQIKKIKDSLKATYLKLEKEYGSLNFLTLNYKQVKMDAAFRREFPYPEQFFNAMRQLQTLGAPRLAGPNFSDQIANLIEPAMIVGYYLTFDLNKTHEKESASIAKCRTDAPFLNGLKTRESKTKQCYRLDAIIKKTKADSVESRRDLYVLGIFDGVNRWIFRLFKDLNGKLLENEKCSDGFTAKYVSEFARGGPNHKMLRSQAGRIGVSDPDEPICPWNPEKFKHRDIPTLFLKGGSDPVIAGDQAETFFKNGLANSARDGVIIEFAGRGHELDVPFAPGFDGVVEPSPSVPTPWGDANTKLLELFLTLSPREFRTNGEVKKQLRTLNAKDITPG